MNEIPVIDPHHAIRAGNITVAVVRCGEDCPRSHHFRRLLRRPAVCNNWERWTDGE